MPDAEEPLPEVAPLPEPEVPTVGVVLAVPVEEPLFEELLLPDVEPVPEDILDEAPAAP